MVFLCVGCSYAVKSVKVGVLCRSLEMVVYVFLEMGKFVKFSIL